MRSCFFALGIFTRFEGVRTLDGKRPIAFHPHAENNINSFVVAPAGRTFPEQLGTVIDDNGDTVNRRPASFGDESVGFAQEVVDVYDYAFAAAYYYDYDDYESHLGDTAQHEDPPTTIETEANVPKCGCIGHPHSGSGTFSDLGCVSWLGKNAVSPVKLSNGSDGAKCPFVGRACAHGSKTECPDEATGFNWIIGTEKNSACTLSYVGAYQYSNSSSDFRRVDSSSFNVAGLFPPQDMRPQKLMEQLRAGKMWLPPYPGGAAEWNAGFTPYPTMLKYKGGRQVEAVGGPAFMFVAKFTGELKQMTWYILNQRILLNGAQNPACVNPNLPLPSKENCWQCGYGEVDILEGNYFDGKLGMTHSNGRVPRGSGDHCLNAGGSSVRDVWDPKQPCGKDPLIAAVFDRSGTTVYINPTWEGLTATTAASRLAAKPASAERVIHKGGKDGMWKNLVDTGQLGAHSCTRSPNE